MIFLKYFLLIFLSLIIFSYEGAEKQMLMALNQVKSVKQSTLSSKWESLLNNLGHTARKLGKLGELIFPDLIMVYALSFHGFL